MKANIYGYIRVSTKEQNEDRQVIALLSSVAGNALRIIAKKYTLFAEKRCIKNRAAFRENFDGFDEKKREIPVTKPFVTGISLSGGRERIRCSRL